MLVVPAEAPSVGRVVPAGALRLFRGRRGLLAAEHLLDVVDEAAQRRLEAHTQRRRVLQVARLRAHQLRDAGRRARAGRRRGEVDAAGGARRDGVVGRGLGDADGRRHCGV